MGLIGDLIGLARANRGLKNMVESGMVTQEQLDALDATYKEERKRQEAAEKRRKNAEEQARIRHECCYNCEYLTRNGIFSDNTNPYTCTKHHFDFTDADDRDGKLHRSTCDDFWER